MIEMAFVIGAALLGMAVGAAAYHLYVSVDRRDCHEYMADTEAALARQSVEIRDLKLHLNMAKQARTKAEADTARLAADRDNWRARAMGKTA